MTTPREQAILAGAEFARNVMRDRDEHTISNAISMLMILTRELLEERNKRQARTSP